MAGRNWTRVGWEHKVERASRTSSLPLFNPGVPDPSKNISLQINTSAAWSHANGRPVRRPEQVLHMPLAVWQQPSRADHRAVLLRWIRGLLDSAEELLCDELTEQELDWLSMLTSRLGQQKQLRGLRTWGQLAAPLDAAGVGLGELLLVMATLAHQPDDLPRTWTHLTPALTAKGLSGDDGPSCRCPSSSRR